MNLWTSHTKHYLLTNQTSFKPQQTWQLVSLAFPCTSLLQFLPKYEWPHKNDDTYKLTTNFRTPHISPPPVATCLCSALCAQPFTVHLCNRFNLRCDTYITLILTFTYAVTHTLACILRPIHGRKVNNIESSAQTYVRKTSKTSLAHSSIPTHPLSATTSLQCHQSIK